VLIGLVLSTLTDNQTIEDEDMALPPDWQHPNPTTAPRIGHKKQGRTIALHSLAVLPELQDRRIGSSLLCSFMRMVRQQGAADRIALITFERLIIFYERFGFTCLGKSKAQYGGEEWWDMVGCPEPYCRKSLNSIGVGCSRARGISRMELGMGAGTLWYYAVRGEAEA
jgi:ribosomal protein S18 acetylase RimI-like enzyme